MAGKDLQDKGLQLNKDAASFSWNFEANQSGTKRNIVCGIMREHEYDAPVIHEPINNQSNTGSNSNSRPTCPEEGPNVTMPANCKPRSPSDYKNDHEYYQPSSHRYGVYVILL